MIRVLQKADIERVVDIWLDTNLKAHYFIPSQYWKNNIDLVKEKSEIILKCLPKEYTCNSLLSKRRF